MRLIHTGCHSMRNYQMCFNIVGLLNCLCHDWNQNKGPPGLNILYQLSSSNPQCFLISQLSFYLQHLCQASYLVFFVSCEFFACQKGYLSKGNGSKINKNLTRNTSLGFQIIKIKTKFVQAKKESLKLNQKNIHFDFNR